jgi:T5SS/PEP-CTERM-associated repeat protein
VTGEIGFVSDSSGTVTVSGPNGTWTNTGTVFVGDNGTGELTIQNAGLCKSAASVYSFPIQDLGRERLTLAQHLAPIRSRLARSKHLW